MKVEEKIARAYHRELSWRKVLVRLEPDAHNNMIVRRMFANAYGWPVVKHLCDTHFSDSVAATTPDSDETNEERAKDYNEAPDSGGNEIKDTEPSHPKPLSRTASEAHEALDSVPALNPVSKPGHLSNSSSSNVSPRKGSSSTRAAQQSATGDLDAWHERYWEDSAGDSDEEYYEEEQAVEVDEEDGKRKSHPDNNKKTATSSTGGGWNWTEVIAGRGLSQSPKGIKDGGAGGQIQGEDGRRLGSGAASS
jgi:hypothetical protein